MTRRNRVAAVLDASAILAYLKGERGRGAVRAIIGRAAISTVNLAEVLAKSSSPEDDLEDLSQLGVTVFEFTQADALESSALVPLTRRAGLSLGDRACIALARRLGAAAFTADEAWSRLELDVEVRLIR